MSYKKLEQELLKDKSFKKYFEENKLSHEIAVSIISARILKGMSQKELAEKMGIKQPNIARWENGTVSPSNESLAEIAKALGTKLILPKFESLEDKNKSANESYEIRNVFMFDHVVSKTAQTSLKSDGSITLKN